MAGWGGGHTRKARLMAAFLLYPLALLELGPRLLHHTITHLTQPITPKKAP